ncbi:hypothetical protein Ddye_030018 [Dipteronia dyeriana]|uniref:RNase H type-1 domain-containing protein n=1 Tax=Dipteronia dyeriana TaxID=168575 RepID=A0AAD9TG96_9ROSI|nr:hypothetical protein Ddye_030018 [Dipteronia dyeriana]
MRRWALDALVWKLRPDGIFLVGSFLGCLDDPSMVSPFDPKLIWSGFYPPKIEIFAWQLLRGRVMVGQVGMCLTIKNSRAWRSLLLALAWNVLEARNQVVFKGVSMLVDQASDMVKFSVAWWFKHHSKGSTMPISTMLLNVKDNFCDSKPFKNCKEVARISLADSALKFNVDGWARENLGNAGIGGVLRDNSGKVLGWFSSFVNVKDSNMAELLAIHKAVSLCAQLVPVLA